MCSEWDLMGVSSFLKDENDAKKVIDLFKNKNFDPQDISLLRFFSSVVSLHKEITDVEKSLTDDFALAKYYQHVTQDYEKMIDHYEKSLESGNVEAALRLGEYYRNLSLDHYRKNLHSVNESANDSVNESVNDSVNVAEKYEELALKYYTIYGSDEELGMFYRLMNQHDTAIEYFKKSNTRRSYYYMSKCYYSKEDTENEIKCLEMSASLGDVDAMFDLAFHYNESNNIDAHDKYIMYLTKSAKAGNGEAYDFLLQHYYDCGDFDNVLDCADEGLLNENVKNYHDVMYMYLGMIYLKTNVKLAKKYLKKSVELENNDSMITLASIYMNECKKEKAIALYEKASEEGNSEALYQLGKFYFNTDKEKSLEYYKKSAKMKNANSIMALVDYWNEILSLSKETEQFLDKCVTYFLILIDLGKLDFVYKILNQRMNSEYITLIQCILDNEDSNNYHMNTYFYINFAKYVDNYEYIENSIDDMNDAITTETSNIILKHLYEKYVKPNIKCEKGYISDFIIYAICDDVTYEYYCHSFAFNSEYFRTMIDSNFAGTNSITINVSSLKVIDSFLEYIYLGTLSIDISLIDELISISREYLFKDLRKYCTCIKYLNKDTIQKYFPSIKI